jgi:auxin responsive GH3 family protein
MDNNKLGCKRTDSLEELEMLTVNVKKVQHLILSKIVQRNHASEYLRKFMDRSTNICRFKRNVPVVKYDSLR